MASIKNELYKTLTSDPEHWWFGDKHNVLYKPSGDKFWVANGFMFFQCRPNPVSLGIVNRYRLWRWLRKAKAMQIINRTLNQR